MKLWAIYTILAVNTRVRLPHPRSGESQGLETFLASSVDKQIRNYDTRVLKRPSLPIKLNSRSKGLSNFANFNDNIT